MNKHVAIELLGGTVAKAAEAVGINSQAVSQWPETLPPRIADRVQAALWRKHCADGLSLIAVQPSISREGESHA